MRFTYRRLCVPALILYLSRRTLGRGLLSLCRGYTSESWSSPFYVSSGNRPSSPHIHLEDQQKWISLINKEFKVACWQISVNTASDRCHIWFYLVIFTYGRSIFNQMNTFNPSQLSAAKIFFWGGIFQYLCEPKSPLKYLNSWCLRCLTSRGWYCRVCAGVCAPNPLKINHPSYIFTGLHSFFIKREQILHFIKIKKKKARKKWDGHINPAAILFGSIQFNSAAN